PEIKEDRVVLRWAIVFCAFAASAAPRFEPASLCSLCHSTLPQPGNEKVNVAPYSLWLGSMKANSARDPYWKAKVRQEVAGNPTAAAFIEDKCLRCHAPAQQYPYRSAGKGLRLSALNQQGEDGVNCTVCHQITAAGLGRKSSFTAGFEIGAEDRIFGPHDDPFQMPMLHHTGYQPTKAAHFLEAGLCATCHTVITPTLDSSGKTAGEFLEQAPYLEWLASSLAAEGRSCQSCHMPLLSTASYIAHRPPGGPFPPTSPRTPYGRHFFAGGNVQGPAMLAEIVPGRAEAFQDAATRAREFLSKAVQLRAGLSWRTGLLEVQVDVENHTGHKLPTAYPSRRLWLHVKALDSAGQVLFESGAWDPATRELRGAPAAQPHYRRISSPERVMVYEAEYADVEGQPTTSLLRAARYSKDNRILPRGFDLKTKLPDDIAAVKIAPVGTGGDPDFLPGADRITYEIPISGTRRPARVVIEALYQSIKPAHARATAAPETPEARRFGELYQRHGDPVSMATVEVPVPGLPRFGLPGGAR
ncbi:MAG: multiheme c-type cytochrome, partial [Acidobacteria bacterium]|nr:multiheme c-type cytochrome [Acidobacteriota bacterium]